MKYPLLINCPKCGHMIHGRPWRCPGCGGSCISRESGNVGKPRQGLKNRVATASKRK